MAANTKMLSVGSGDGSQQAAILRAGHQNIVTTFYDSKPVLLQKYPSAAENVAYLESQSQVFYDTDATTLHTKALGTYDLIFFTFPHTGVPNGQPDSVQSNQDLLRSFLCSASSMLNPNGEIQITLKTTKPYDQWRLPSLLEEVCKVTLIDTQRFDKSLFPGYVHRLTRGMDGPLKEVKDEGAQIYIFGSSTEEDADTPAEAIGKLIKIVQLPSCHLSDEEVAIGAQAVLNSGGARGLTVLDIRREFEEGLRPNTRQLNRVLYQGVRTGQFKISDARSSTSSKPVWSLSA